MGCRGGSCSCGKGNHSSIQENQRLVQLSVGLDQLSDPGLLKGLESLSVDEEVVEVRFKNNRKIIYRNIHGLDLIKDDRVVVEAEGGFDLGTISLTGDLAQKQFDNGSGLTKKSSLFKIYRKASQEDIAQWIKGKKSEREVLLKSRDLASGLNQDIQINDAEFRSDGMKVKLFYAADKHVDVKDLIRIYEAVLGIKVEMKQASFMTAGISP